MTALSAAHGARERARLERVNELRAGGAGNVPALVEELVEPTWSVRRAVIAALATLGQPAIAPLCRILRETRDNEAKIAGVVDALVASSGRVEEDVLALSNDTNLAVICDAVQILGRRESTLAVRTLSRLTAHENDNVALAAIEALGRIGGGEVLEPLLALAESGNFFRAFPAIDALGRLRDSRAIPVLIRLLPDPLYGLEAIRALSRVGDYSALAPLVEQLSRANESTVRAVALALATIHERSLSRFGDAALVERVVQGAHHLPQLRRQLLSALTRADSSEQLALMQVLSWVGEEGTVPHLLALLDTAGPVADGAVASLKRLRGSAEPQLIEALRVGNSARRRLLVPLLGGHLAAGAELAACLDDEDPTVRALACDALAHSGDTRHVDAIFPLLGDPDLRVSQAALAAIQSLGSAETKELALRAAYAENAQVRAAVLRVLGYFAYPEGLSALVAASRDPDESLRLAALSGLPLMDAPAALDAVLVARSHRSARTRAAAVRALGQMTDRPQVIDSLLAALSDPDPWVRYYACQSLGKARNESTTEALASLLGDGSGQVRVAAVEALAHLSGERAFEVLAALMHAEDPDLFRAALVGLGISKRKEALKPLRLAAISPIAATRLVALSALGELGLPESVAIFASAAEDTDPGVRTAAESFLAAHTHPSASAELVRLLSKDPSRESLIQALARPVPGRVDAVLAALRFADDALASALVSALARTHSEAANAGLRAAFASESPAARRAAAAALVASGDPLASQAIEVAAVSDGDAEVRRICSAYLAR